MRTAEKLGRKLTESPSKGKWQTNDYTRNNWRSSRTEKIDDRMEHTDAPDSNWRQLNHRADWWNWTRTTESTQVVTPRICNWVASAIGKACVPKWKGANCSYDVQKCAWPKTNLGSRMVLRMMRWHWKGAANNGRQQWLKAVIRAATAEFSLTLVRHQMVCSAEKLCDSVGRTWYKKNAKKDALIRIFVNRSWLEFHERNCRSAR